MSLFVRRQFVVLKGDGGRVLISASLPQEPAADFFSSAGLNCLASSASKEASGASLCVEGERHSKVALFEACEAC